MLRFFSLLVRRPDVSAQEFSDHWRHPHDTMGRLISGLRSYVQAHQIDTELLGPGQSDRIQQAHAFFQHRTDAQNLTTTAP